MSWMLLVGAALNLAGAAAFLIFEGRPINGEWALFKWFTAGVAGEEVRVVDAEARARPIPA